MKLFSTLKAGVQDSVVFDPMELKFKNKNSTTNLIN